MVLLDALETENMITIQNCIIENEIDWERQSEDQAEYLAGKQSDAPDFCPCCGRPIPTGDCLRCEISFNMPF